MGRAESIVFFDVPPLHPVFEQKAGSGALRRSPSPSNASGDGVGRTGGLVCADGSPRWTRAGASQRDVLTRMGDGALAELSEVPRTVVGKAGAVDQRVWVPLRRIGALTDQWIRG